MDMIFHTTNHNRKSINISDYSTDIIKNEW